MKYILILVLVVFIACDSKTTTLTSFQESVVDVSTPIRTENSKAVDPRDSTKVPRVYKMPDFTKYASAKEKKQAFFDFLRPMINEENANLERERAYLQQIYDQQSRGEDILSKDADWVTKRATAVRVKDFSILNADSRLALKKKIDIIPPAMFLAQAANESAWGTSRFAREANNFLGQWCFTPGCGIIPAQRPAGRTHEVKKFATVNAAVASYVENINRHKAYSSLRELRYAEREKGKIPSGTICAGGLLQYSGRGETYVKEIRTLIRVNQLETL